MTFEEAENFKEKYKHVHSQLVELTETPFYIRHFLIAPKGLENKIDLLNENIFKSVSNKTALKNMGMLNNNLDVFIIGAEKKGLTQDERLQVYNLYDYLSATEQL